MFTHEQKTAITEIAKEIVFNENFDPENLANLHEEAHLDMSRETNDEIVSEVLRISEGTPQEARGKLMANLLNASFNMLMSINNARNGNDDKEAAEALEKAIEEFLSSSLMPSDIKIH